VKYPGVFVTGTGTSVGKTIVSASLVCALRAIGILVAASKPFATGVQPDTPWQDDDAKLLAAAAGIQNLSLVSPNRFTAPLAPVTAAELENRAIDIGATAQAIRQTIQAHQFTVVEGVGGAAVPITSEYLVSDFARELQLPVLVVARSDLGTINHTLLTIEHLRNRGCDVLGIIFVRHNAGELSQAEATAPIVIQQFSKLPSFGMVPHVPALPGAATASEALELLPSQSAAIQALVGAL
jgi:dethiobiotin synthetase